MIADIKTMWSGQGTKLYDFKKLTLHKNLDKDMETDNTDNTYDFQQPRKCAKINHTQ